MQQSTACLHFAWRTTSLRVGGRAARRSCLPGLRRGGGGRQAGATATAGRTPIQNALVGRSGRLSLTATPDTTRRSCLCRAWCAGVN